MQGSADRKSTEPIVRAGLTSDSAAKLPTSSRETCCGTVERWSSSGAVQHGEEAATATAAGADPNAEKSGQGRSGQVRAGQGWTGADRHNGGQKNGTTFSSQIVRERLEHGAGRSQHGPARRSKQPGLDLHARNLQQAIRTFLARGYLLSMALPVPADSTTSPLPANPATPPSKHPPAPTDLMPAGLESVQHPYASRP